MDEQRRRIYDRLRPDEIKQAIRDIFENRPEERGTERVDRALVLAGLLLVLVAVASYLGFSQLWPDVR
jgi:hypothetical protein